MAANDANSDERPGDPARTNDVVFGSRDEELKLAEAALARYLPGCRLARAPEQRRPKRRVHRGKRPAPSLAELKAHFGMPPIPLPSNPHSATLIRVYEVIRDGQPDDETRTVAIAFVATGAGLEGHVVGIEY